MSRKQVKFRVAAAAVLAAFIPTVFLLWGCAVPGRGPRPAESMGTGSSTGTEGPGAPAGTEEGGDAPAPLAGSPAAISSGAQSTGTAASSPAAAAGRPELDESSALSDYLSFAARNNPGLKAAYDRWKAALERVAQAGAMPDPRISYSYFIEEVETRVGPQRQKFGLSQTFPWFGKLDLREDVAARAAKAEMERFRAAAAALFEEVKDAFFEYGYLARAVTITKQNIQLLTDLEKAARTRYKVGAAPYSSVIKAQVELGILTDRLRTIEDLRGPVAARLNAALGRPAGAPLPEPKTIPVEPVSLPEEGLEAALAARNPELAALDDERAAKEASIDVARKDSYPDFTLGVDYIDTRGARMPGVSDSGKDPVTASLSLNIPFFSKKYPAAIREAELRHRAAVRELRDKGNKLAAELKRALFAFRDAERKIDLYRDTLLPKAEQSFQVTRKAFETGRTDFLDLVDAQRILLEFQLSYERSLADRGRALAEIERLLGGTLPGAGEAPAAGSAKARAAAAPHPIPPAAGSLESAASSASAPSSPAAGAPLHVPVERDER